MLIMPQDQSERGESVADGVATVSIVKIDGPRHKTLTLECSLVTLVPT